MIDVVCAASPNDENLVILKGDLSMLQDERYAQLAAAIEEMKDLPGALMPVLQAAQGIFGCVPMEAQQMIADGLGKTLSEVYGVVTFYAQFTLRPQGKYTISVCLGTACYVRGSNKVLDELSKQLGIEVGASTEDGLFTLKATRCLGACGLAPVMTVNEEVYGRMKPEDVKDVLDKYRKLEGLA